VKIRSMGDAIGTYGWNFAYQSARADGASVLAAVLVANDQMARYLARDDEWRVESGRQQKRWWEDERRQEDTATRRLPVGRGNPGR
jgi:hypothetical protein